jgi:hypothetical protein
VEGRVDDARVFERINELSAEEEKLYAAAADGGGLDADEVARLETIKVALDQAYDLLHQREARRAAGLDPREAELRPEETVERYQQ